MKYYGTKNNKDYGFYLENFENALEITDDYWMELLDEQSKGKIIILYKNSVIAVDENEYSNQDGIWVKLSPEEVAQKKQKKQNEIRAYHINNELQVLDQKRIRAMAEPSEKEEGISWLDYYNKEIIKLRNELKTLNE